MTLNIVVFFYLPAYMYYGMITWTVQATNTATNYYMYVTMGAMGAHLKTSLARTETFPSILARTVGILSYITSYRPEADPNIAIRGKEMCFFFRKSDFKAIF